MHGRSSRTGWFLLLDSEYKHFSRRVRTRLRLTDERRRAIAGQFGNLMVSDRIAKATRLTRTRHGESNNERIMPDGGDFERRISAGFPPTQWSDAGVLVAFSGGADSTALLAALAALRPASAGDCLVAAHFNHRLRGPESDADAAHCVETSRQLGVRCEVGTGNTAAAASEQGDGLEAAARDDRYRFLEATAARLGLRYIATAHTLDDQAETVLHRLLRGTGVAGLAGMRRARPLAGATIGLVRPLLEFRRAELLVYVSARGLKYRTDASNADVRFTRNRIRNELLPQLARDYNPRIVETLARLATQADELREVIAGLIEPVVDGLVRRADAAGCELDCGALADAPRHLVREALIAVWRRQGLPEQGMGYVEWDALAELATDAAVSKRMFPGGVTAQRIGDALRLRRAPSPS